MMLVCIYNMPENGEESDPIERKASDEQGKIAIELLTSRGYDVPHLRVPA